MCALMMMAPMAMVAAMSTSSAIAVGLLVLGVAIVVRAIFRWKPPRENEDWEDAQW